MNISDLAVEIVETVQTELSNKSSHTRINRQVASILNKLVASLSDVDDDCVVAVNMQEGIPFAVSTNNAALHGALFVCTDHISVADDEESAIIAYDDNIVVGIGKVSACDDISMYMTAARKFSRANN